MLITFLCLFIPFQLIPEATTLIQADTDRGVLLLLFPGLRATFWMLAAILVMLFVVVADDEARARRCLRGALGFYLFPAAVFSLISARSILLDARSDWDSRLGKDFALISRVVTYLIATGAGLVAAVQTIAPRLRQLGTPPELADSVFMLTTVVGFGTRFSGNALLAQVWSFVDPYCVIYIALWNTAYIVKSRSLYTKNRNLRWACNFTYLAVAIAIIVRLSLLDEVTREFVLWAIGEYLALTLVGTVTVVVVGYFTASLAQLVILDALVSRDPVAPPPDSMAPEELEMARDQSDTVGLIA